MISGFVFRALEGRIVVAVGILLGIGILVPALNLLTPPDSALHIPTYAMSLFGKYLCYALLALALDLVWGYCGILSLGHGAFFALGGYAMGMYLMRQIGSRGVYGNPILPDFMVFLNWKELPWFWHGFDWFVFAMVMVLVVPGLLAFVFGWFAFRSRVNGVYLSIITQAMTYALLLAFFRNDMGFGGNNGLTDFKDILGFSVQADGTRAVLFFMSALMLSLCLILASAIVRSKFGKVLVGVRDAESRVRFLGFRVENIKLFTFVVSAMMAGIAGALFVPQVGIINPGEFAPANSIEVVVWTAVGGRGTLIGPIIGAILVNGGKSFFTGAFPEIWLFALGGLFIAVTLFLPKGIVGTIQHGFKARQAMKAAADAEKGRGDAVAAAQTQAQAAE
ncbi:urea ABC transporter permease subunit UrtC [Neorhizobium galegae]|uniref:urea ABC transporter permease subunit UrtC n=1 Tax=Neorhizobium galegae TaxID=399 RepID=UPI0006222192|nr:urea ABC transporter permease subunit UrtC [Neorhizobium galegae]CDZ28259.1 Urea ABC transporter, permease protein UrtC [Neorhizobium galegae bv. officinalis]KAA9388039.1 urea ABC transporter permease subunit UrtC [Neorhizobium galegae]KAB1115497.1 urea ABC transporter permease subunit UrtC [Neorhizobium galegae]MCM2500490.1 urea ABC transporter permease subunit UrtC [Neorhizobium galegae]MCQ1773400.1 urea ABC transporter permease subunit UrtC [Neorhizobium galegae]